MKLPWTEKHRPAVLDDVVGNAAIVGVFKTFVATQSMPNLVISGAPGIGKTTTTFCFIRTFLRPQEGGEEEGRTENLLKVTRESVLELNASDERGIDVVRTKIKAFLQKKLSTESYKFVILDESDAMTNAAQQAMRRLMEKHSKECRFVLICNDLSKINDALQSRCAMLKFEPLSRDDLETIARKVCAKEGFRITGEAVEMVIASSNNDARQLLNTLQTASHLASGGRVLDDWAISKSTSVPPLTLTQKLMDLISQKNFDGALDCADAIFDDGYSYEDVIKTLFKNARRNGDIAVMEVIGMYVMRISEGCGSRLQFYSLIHEMLSQ